MSELDNVFTGMGSLNDRRFSNGNVYPVTALPFGMANFTLQTDGGAGNWFYSPLAHSFEGIRLTHQPSPWVGDYGHMLFFPFSGELPERERWSSFRPKRLPFVRTKWTCISNASVCGQDLRPPNAAP